MSYIGSMTLFQDETNSPASAEATASLLLDAVPLIMRLIRAEMRSHRSPDLSVPQFRALLYIHQHAGTSLSSVADHLGLTLSTTSKLVERLVLRGLVVRASAPHDRRRMALFLTEDGAAILSTAADATLATLAGRLAVLDAAERSAVADALRLLQAVFTAEG